MLPGSFSLPLWLLALVPVLPNDSLGIQAYGRRNDSGVSDVAAALVRRPLVCFVSLGEQTAFRSTVWRTLEDETASTSPTALAPRGPARTWDCRMRVTPVSAAGAQVSLALYRNITEETDEDLF